MIKVLVAVLVLAGCAAPPQILEDDPRWDCHSMGNKICGKE